MMNKTDIGVKYDPERDFISALNSSISLIEELLSLHQVVKPTDYQRIRKLYHYRNIYLEWIDTIARETHKNNQISLIAIDTAAPTVYARPNASSDA